jgi:hypothetical protein
MDDSLLFVADREAFMFQLGRMSADEEWVFEQEERARLEACQELGDIDLVCYTLGRLSTLWEESEVSHAVD